MAVETLWGNNMNKKILIISAFSLVAIFALFGGPIDLLVNFLLAGVIPGVKFTVGPFAVLLIMFAASTALACRMFHIEIPSVSMSKIELVKPIQALKITTQSHRRVVKRRKPATAKAN
jgi:hypothetical protein